MTRENRAALLKRLKNLYKDCLKKPFPEKSLIYLRGSYERSKLEDDTSHQPFYEANFSYLVGLNCLYYDSVIDLATDEVFLVDVLDTYKDNYWRNGVTSQQMEEFRLKAILGREELGDFVRSRDTETIFINRGVHRGESRLTHFWVPKELEEFRAIMDFDSLYPQLCLTRTVKNPTELKLMKEVR